MAAAATAAVSFGRRLFLSSCISIIGRRNPPSSSTISPSTNPSRFLSSSSSFFVPGRLGLGNVLPKHAEPAAFWIHAPLFQSVRRIFRQSFNLPGWKIVSASVLGVTVASGIINDQSKLAYALDSEDCHADFEGPSGYLKDELHTFWALVKKFQLPVILFLMVLFGWRHPITLAINVALLLFCSRPNPSSVYIFVEQMRQRDLRQEPRLHKSKFLYAKRVDVEDYKFLCLAKVELWDVKLNLIGILGGWWIFHTSKS